MQCLDDGSGIAPTMLKNEAIYHNRCREHFLSHNQRSNLFTFTNRPPTDLKKGTDKLGSAKANTALFTKKCLCRNCRYKHVPTQMYRIFFQYENQREPPSLSDRGKLRPGTKSDILGCLPGMLGPEWTPAARSASVVVLDMAAVVHIIKPQRASVFGEYTEMQLLPYLESHMMDRTTRVDAIWDTYRLQRQVSSPKLGSNGVGLRDAEHGSQTRYLYPRELNGSRSSRIVKTKMSFSSSSVGNYKGSQSIHSRPTICWQQRLVSHLAISLQTYQICQHVDKRKLTHGWCSTCVMLLIKVIQRRTNHHHHHHHHHNHHHQDGR